MNKARLLDIITTCRNEGRHLTKWEENILDQWEERLAQGRTLSEREEEIIMNIYREKADG